MADAYGGTGLSEEEKKASWKKEVGASAKSALSTGGQYASLGATVGSAGGVVGSAIGAGIGFLVGAGIGAFTDDYDRKAENEKAKQAKKLERMSEDASRSAQAAAATASKGGGTMRSASLPAAPSDMSVLASSMPMQAGGRMPMDPYRRTVMNKFGWS